MKCLVTGGAGFIGSHLVERLVREGHEVRVFDNFLTGKRENLAVCGADGAVDVVEGDVRDREALEAAVQDVDVVFHQAALPSVPRSIEDPRTSAEINGTGTLNVLEAARRARVERFVYASSSSVYGDSANGAKGEDIAPAPRSPYAASKLAGEAYCRGYAAAFGMHTVSLRYFNVFGPRQDSKSTYAGVMPRFITAMLAGRAPTIFGDGNQTRDFTFVDNVVSLNLLAARAQCEPGRVFNAAFGEQFSLNQLITLLRPLTDYDGPVVYASARPGEVRHSLADVGRAERELGYRPLVDLPSGLAQTVEALRDLPAPRAAAARSAS